MPHSSCRLRNLLITLTLMLAAVLPTAAQAATTPVTLGVNIDNAPDQLTALQSYAQVAGGVKPAIVMWYQAWSEPLYWSAQQTNMKTFGGVPMITWDPIVNGAGVPLSDIVAGKYDSYILASAQAAKAWGSLMYIRLAHEMNLAGSPFGPGKNGNTALEYVAAWRHVVTIFRQAGATNVEWVWSPNVQCGGSCPFTSFYPGDQWVDWVALDGYNYAGVDNVPWWTFSQVFGPSITTMKSLTTRPLMIGETASSNLGGSQASWITQAFLQQIPSLYPNIRAAIWFDRNKETDWRVNSSLASQTAWDTVVASPLYQGTAATLQSIAPLSTDVTTGTTSTGTTSTGSTGSTSTGSTGSTSSGSTSSGSTTTSGSTSTTTSGSGKSGHGGSTRNGVQRVVRSGRHAHPRACRRHHRRHHRRVCRARHHRRHRHHRHNRRQARLSNLVAAFVRSPF
jgi:hypothetical protein